VIPLVYNSAFMPEKLHRALCVLKCCSSLMTAAVRGWNM